MNIFSTLWNALTGKRKKKMPSPLGVMYLTTSDQAGQPKQETQLAASPGWMNSLAKGMAIRTTWARLEGDSVVGSSEGTFYWGYLDLAKSLAASHGKKWSVLVTAGVTCPSWVFSDGAYSFTESTTGLPMPLPWDTVFQTKWKGFLQSFFTRYGSDPNLGYVVMGGFGRRAESFFVTSSGDQTAIDTLAAASGHNWSPFAASGEFSSGLMAWQSGAKWCIDQYHTYFPSGQFIADSGQPYPTTSGNDSIQAVSTYGSANYLGHYGFKTDGLTQGAPVSPAIGYTEVVRLAPTSLVGYQFNLPQKGNTVTMQSALNLGINNGAKFIEVYAGDCDDPTQAANLTNANIRMLASASDGTAGGLGCFFL